MKVTAKESRADRRDRTGVTPIERHDLNSHTATEAETPPWRNGKALSIIFSLRVVKSFIMPIISHQPMVQNLQQSRYLSFCINGKQKGLAKQQWLVPPT